MLLRLVNLNLAPRIQEHMVKELGLFVCLRFRSTFK